MKRPAQSITINGVSQYDTIAGCLLGGAVGDALGLPYERLKSSRVNRLFGAIDHQFKHHLFFDRGMISDDTEHSLFTAMAIGKANGDAGNFSRHLAGFLKRWIIAFPAGVGKATLIACGRLLVGVSPERSGIFSAGNGPAMRAPIIGVLAKNDHQLIQLVKRSSRITHTDPKAEIGALAVAAASRYASQRGHIDADDYLGYLTHLLDLSEFKNTTEFLELLSPLFSSIRNNQTTEEYARQSGLNFGVSGYIYHTVPIVLHAWLSDPNNYQEAVLSVIRCGGDTDTTAAITGGIVGAHTGKAGIPPSWIDGLLEFPFSVRFIEKLSKDLANGKEIRSYPMIYFPIVLLRNLFFFVVIMFHVFRRLLPPY